MLQSSESPTKPRRRLEQNFITSTLLKRVLTNIDSFEKTLEVAEDHNDIFLFSIDKDFHLEEILKLLVSKDKSELAIRLINRIDLTTKTESEAIYHLNCFDAVTSFCEDRSKGENCISFKLVKHMIERGFDPGLLKKRNRRFYNCFQAHN